MTFYRSSPGLPDLQVGNIRSQKMETQAQKNDKLKIQISLMQQLEEQRKLDCDRQALALASVHHQQQSELFFRSKFQECCLSVWKSYPSADKYNFLERAFGEQVPFDHKFAFTASLKNQSLSKAAHCFLNF
eukprot:Skav213185  [mRNA]  locus=scaffold2826:20564:21538:+ [translate_table: standard]